MDKVDNPRHKLNLGTRTAYSQMKETSLKGQLKKRSANDAKATIYSRRSIVAEGSDTIINDDQELLPNSNNQLHHAATTTTRSVPEHTDSGYASLPRRSEKSSFGLQMTAPAKQDDDDATVYSTASSVGTVAKDSYIEAMARLLWQEIHSLRVDNLSLKDISPALCDLLGQFALRFSSSNPDDMHQRIMIFVHKYRRYVLFASDASRYFILSFFNFTFCHKLSIPSLALITRVSNKSYRQIASVFEKIEPQKHNDEDENSTTDSEPGMSVDEKMALWTIETEKPEIEYVPIELPEDHREEDRDLANHLESLVVNDPSYEWLVRRVQRVALCTPSEVQSAIADNITKRIGHGRNVSRKMVSNKPKVSIYISSWDLRAFVQEQAIDARAKDSKDLCFDTIENIITITSSSRSECQALTCGEYLEMIWPELGQEVLHAIWTMILDDKAHLSLKDGTSISAAMNNDSMSVQLEGTVYAIAEVVEILSWLSAALRTSEENIATCLPIISETSFEGQSYPSFKISYSVQELESKGNGQCWHKMFRSSMVVLGYPIRRRAAMLGLEISLPVVTKLLCSDRMNVFNGKLILKGFSAMLLPTDQNGDFVQWHYIYQKKGDYLDFSAADSFDGAGVNERDMRKRHVIGWCSDAKVIAGAPGPYYSIQRSHLPKSNASIALKSFALSAGSQPGALLEASIAICIKDRPIHVSPAGLGIVDKLRWISQRYVVLYDSQEKRGWLINGVNALLHLLRASLEAYYTDKFNSALKLQPSHITEPTTEYPDAAIDFFLRDGHKNLQLELYVKRFETFMESTKSSTAPGTAKLKTTSVLVQDRVEDLFDILAHAITQQMDMAKREGIYYKPHFKKFLDGWDFKNIATDHSPFEPVVASLDCFQQPWVNMIRALNIPVLFGKGFGEIIQPAKTEQICSRWTTLPKDKIYLAATVATMKKIMERHGDDSAKPMKICDKMLWFHPSSSYSSCQCHNRKDRKHIDNVQVLWPEGLKSKLLRNEAAAHLSANGAVVFGQNNHFSWFRNDCGVAVEGIFRFRRSKSRGEAAAAAEEEEEEEEDFGSIIPAPELSSETSPSINSLSIASASDSTNKLSNSTSSQQSTAQTDPSLTQQTVRSSFSTQTNPSIRLKRKGRLPWLKFDAGEQA